MNRRGISFAGIAAIVAISTLALSASASAVSFPNANPITIPTLAAGNANPYPSNVVVSGQAGLVSDVNVRLNGYSHTRPLEVGVVLVAPGGAAAMVLEGTGGDDDAVNVNYIFDDSAGSHILTAPLTSGTFLPTAYFVGDDFPDPGPGTNYCLPGPVAGGGSCTLNSTFQGLNPNGTWKLFVRDFEGGDGGSISSGWTLDLETTPGQTLSVTTAGAGGGSVSGQGIACPGDCSEAYFPGRTVTLSAQANVNSTFSGWSGDCTGTGPCQVTMNGARSATANFAPVRRDLAVSTTGSGSGTVTGPGISCPADCIESFDHGQGVGLTATPAPGSAFDGWSGNCAGAGNCALTMNGDRAATATFVLVDASPPETRLDRVPQKRTDRRRASFSFSSTEPGSTFECSIDGEPAVPCSSPNRFRVRPGRHTFEVAASDAAFNLDSSPASYRWRVRA